MDVLDKTGWRQKATLPLHRRGAVYINTDAAIA